MPQQVKTLTPGNVWRVLVKPGDQVKEGDVLFVLEVMKMEVPHEAPASGVVKAVYIEEGTENLEGDVIAVEIED